MTRQGFFLLILGVALVGVVLGVNTPALDLGRAAHADDPPRGAWAATGIPGVVAHQSNWIPGSASIFAVGGTVHYGEVIGDLWTFNCPRNGTFSIDLDVMDDTGDAAPFVFGTSNLAPVVEVRDGRGNFLALGYNNVPCHIEPECDFVNCPRVIDVACGTGNPHSITVYSNPVTTCRGGGGYNLGVSAVRRNGRDAPAAALRLGGGAPRIIPSWVFGVPSKGPALDDEGVDSLFFPTTVP